MEVKHSSKAIRIILHSMTMPYSLRGTNIEALHNPIVGISIMSQFLVKNLFGQHAANPNQQTFQKSLGTYFRVLWDRQGRAD